MKGTQEKSNKVLRKFGGQTIGVLGDCLLDELLSGEATRISPEAPVPVILMDSYPNSTLSPGGAVNVAVKIRALGGRPIPFGAVGTDLTGNQLSKELGKRGILCDNLVRERGRVTPRKLRIAAHQQQVLRVDFEKPAPISSKTVARLTRSFAGWAPKLNGLIISDYGKGTVQNELCSQITAIARQRRIPVFVAPKPEHPEICRHSTAVVAGLHDAEIMAGRSMRNRISLEAAGRQLLALLDCSYLLIAGDQVGVVLFGKGGAVDQIAGAAEPAGDFTSARDTMLAILALAFTSGAGMEEAAELAGLAMARVEGKLSPSDDREIRLLETLLGKPAQAERLGRQDKRNLQNGE